MSTQYTPSVRSVHRFHKFSLGLSQEFIELTAYSGMIPPVKSSPASLVLTFLAGKKSSVASLILRRVGLNQNIMRNIYSCYKGRPWEKCR